MHVLLSILLDEGIEEWGWESTFQGTKKPDKHKKMQVKKNNNKN